MKPTFQISPIWKAIDSTRFGGHERKFPEIDFCFHGTVHGPCDSSGYRSPNTRSVGSFHKLGTRYLARETGRDFVADAVVFGIIVAVSAWPIISMIHALAGKMH
jgi:hypothetical protein